MNPEEEKDKKLEDALYTLAIGATVEEIGKDAKGATKVFKRRLAPNLDAIKYLKERKRNTEKLTRWIPKLSGGDIDNGDD